VLQCVFCFNPRRFRLCAGMLGFRASGLGVSSANHLGFDLCSQRIQLRPPVQQRLTEVLGFVDPFIQGRLHGLDGCLRARIGVINQGLGVGIRSCCEPLNQVLELIVLARFWQRGDCRLD
jgi:hypothetical protein